MGISCYNPGSIIDVAVGGIFIKLFGKKRGIIYTIVLVLASVAILIIVFSAPAILNEETANSIKGFTISSALVGCILGGTIAGLVSRNLGRKNGLILAAMLFSISAIGSAMPEQLNFLGVESITAFIFYRIIGGIGVGMASMLSPMYIAEISPARIRAFIIGDSSEVR